MRGRLSRRTLAKARKDIPREFSRALLTRLVTSGIRVADVAERLGWDEWTVRAELGKPTSVSSAAELAYALGCRFDVEIRPKNLTQERPGSWQSTSHHLMTTRSVNS